MSQPEYVIRINEFQRELIEKLLRFGQHTVYQHFPDDDDVRQSVEEELDIMEDLFIDLKDADVAEIHDFAEQGPTVEGWSKLLAEDKQ